MGSSVQPRYMEAYIVKHRPNIKVEKDAGTSGRENQNRFDTFQ